MLNKTQYDIMLANAAELAKKLGMTPMEDITDAANEQLLLIVTENGTNIGEIFVSYALTPTYYIERYLLNGQALFTKTYVITERVREDIPDVTVQMDSASIIYCGGSESA